MTSRHARAAILAACRKLWSIATLYERELAETETRAPAAWAVEAAAGGSTP